MGSQGVGDTATTFTFNVIIKETPEGSPAPSTLWGNRVPLGNNPKSADAISWTFQPAELWETSHGSMVLCYNPKELGLRFSIWLSLSQIFKGPSHSFPPHCHPFLFSCPSFSCSPRVHRNPSSQHMELTWGPGCITREGVSGTGGQVEGN